MISRKSVLILLLCLSAASGAVRAQWKVVAQSALLAGTQHGAMYFKDGVVWAGWATLCCSTDSGQSWTSINFPGKDIADICFADKSTGIITTTQAGAFLTHDGGQTWTSLPSALNLASRVAFGPSPMEAYALPWGVSVLLRSLDGGSSWQTLPTEPVQNMTFALARNGELCLVSGLALSQPGAVSLSSDSGLTWHRTPAVVGRDCWTIAADPGDPDRLYLTEEHAGSPVPVHLYASHDGGNTWNVGYTSTDIAGSLSVSNCAVFAGTEQNGVLRSTDFGASWQKIGGPNGINDNRMVCAINANIVFAVDSFGTIWGTYNGGSDSVHEEINGTLSVSPAALFDTVTCSDSVPETLHVIHDGCLPPTIQNYSILGKDSSSYRITATAFDSLNLLFHPAHSGASHALLVLTLADSSEDTIPLAGWNSVPPNTITFFPHQLFSGDTLTCDSEMRATATYTASGCTPLRILQYAVAGNDSACYRISGTGNDSIDLLFSPDHSGEHRAALLLALSDGTTDSIPLSGNGLMNVPLHCATTDQTTDAVGGGVSVPISLSGLLRPEDVDLIIHYEGDLRYDGSFDPTGAPLDVLGATWTGRARLALKHVTPGSISGYARFTVFADSSAERKVTFDSVLVLGAAPCEYLAASPATSTITGPSGCGRPELSEVLEGQAPVFSIRPNPTSGTVSVESLTRIDSASVEVIDALGVERERRTVSFTNGPPVALSLPQNPGVYCVRIECDHGIFSTNIVLVR